MARLLITVGDPLVTVSRLSMMHTAAEVAEVRRRIAGGEYVAAGDMFTNSPDDWTRLQAWANTAQRPWVWDGPTRNLPGSGFPEAGTAVNPNGAQIPPGRDSTPADEDRLLAAAYVHLYARDTILRDAVRDDILAQIAKPALNFADRTLYPNPFVTSNTGWNNASRGHYWGNFFVKIALAFDAIMAADVDYGETTFTAQQVADILAWLFEHANFLRGTADEFHNRFFVDRWADNYNDPGGKWSGTNRIAYWTTAGKVDGIHAEPGVHGAYNNRALSCYRTLALLTEILAYHGFTGWTGGSGTTLGLSLALARASVIRAFKEYIQISLFGDGQYLSEFYRGTVDDLQANQAMSYGASMMASLSTIADVVARAGDTSLFTYWTRTGWVYTGTTPTALSATAEAAAKSLLTFGQVIARYAAQTNANPFGTKRYGGLNDHSGDPAFLIDFRSDRVMLGYNQIAVMNRWYQDTLLRTTYKGTAAGLPNPAYLASGTTATAQSDDWDGDWGIHLALGLRFFDMEGISPYPGG